MGYAHPEFILFTSSPLFFFPLVIYQFPLSYFLPHFCLHLINSLSPSLPSSLPPSLPPSHPTELWQSHQLGWGAPPRQKIWGLGLLLRQWHCHSYSRASKTSPTCAVYRHRYSPWRWCAGSLLSDWPSDDRVFSQVWKLFLSWNRYMYMYINIEEVCNVSKMYVQYMYMYRIMVLLVLSGLIVLTLRLNTHSFYYFPRTHTNARTHTHTHTPSPLYSLNIHTHLFFCILSTHTPQRWHVRGGGREGKALFCQCSPEGWHRRPDLWQPLQTHHSICHWALQTYLHSPAGVCVCVHLCVFVCVCVRLHFGGHTMWLVDLHHQKLRHSSPLQLGFGSGIIQAQDVCVCFHCTCQH